MKVFKHSLKLKEFDSEYWSRHHTITNTLSPIYPYLYLLIHPTFLLHFKFHISVNFPQI